MVTFATSDILSHAPPTSEYFPSPILDKITVAESSGPTANGVCLIIRDEKRLVIQNSFQKIGQHVFLHYIEGADFYLLGKKIH